jgi:hypothetical protein
VTALPRDRGEEIGTSGVYLASEFNTSLTRQIHEIRLSRKQSPANLTPICISINPVASAIAPSNPHIRNMEQFEYNQPADLFARAGHGQTRPPVTYRKFTTGAEALRYAVEVLSESLLQGTVVETDLGRFEASDIRTLYDSPDYPLPRPQTS